MARAVRQVRCRSNEPRCRRLIDVRSRGGDFGRHTVTCKGCRTVWRIDFNATPVAMTPAGRLDG